jgi:hypothetical protein
MALTLFAIQNAKPKEKPHKLSDGNGLHLLVETNGSRLWRFRYQFDRKEKMLSLGAFPEVSLASARTKRDDARKLVAEGIDPSQQKRLDKIERLVGKVIPRVLNYRGNIVAGAINVGAVKQFERLPEIASRIDHFPSLVLCAFPRPLLWCSTWHRYRCHPYRQSVPPSARVSRSHVPR